MEACITEQKFFELTEEESFLVEGGSGKQVAQLMLGTVALAWSVPLGVVCPGGGLALAGGALACIDAAI